MLRGVLTPQGTLRGELASRGTLYGTLSMASHSYPGYSGETEVTPSEYVQTLATSGKAVMSNITVNPIPSNYGLITYTGSSIIVS